MKKLMPFLVLILLIISTPLFLLFKSNKDKVKFPHFKQAPMEYLGTVYGTINKEFQLSFNFLDENTFSEMAQENNIKEMYIIDHKERIIPAHTWQINSTSFVDYEIRNIHTKMLFNELDTFIFKKLVIKYMDNVTEEFSVGSLNIVIDNEYTKESIIYNSSQELIMCSDNTYSNFSGILITLGNVTDNANENNIELINIDLGIEDFGIDGDNIKIINKHISDINIDEITQHVKYPKPVEEVTKSIPSTKINFKNSDIVTLLIPFTIPQNKIKENKIYVFNPKLTFRINGKEYDLIGDQNLISTPSLSTKNFNGDIDGKKIIEEFGL
ncbi:hypothetical protein KQI89_14910 [Clostridium sp. MSJ-4]|uniref:Membrane associated protein n=1 Tax=Clostridium simiarum TaxID=2841506 RepID=A0ABS6F3H1_9CLOT|nr:hypothetical protein [Clostridium simiarum]MBU5593040.1 hypothetical protein [Clostridium simiarum]